MAAAVFFLDAELRTWNNAFDDAIFNNHGLVVQPLLSGEYLLRGNDLHVVKLTIQMATEGGRR